MHVSPFDNFMHIRPEGHFLEAVKSFKNAGGASFNLVNFPEGTYGKNHYIDLYEKTLRVGKSIRNLGINIIITLGPYPADYLHFQQKELNPVDEMKNGIDIAVKLINDGKADALGEIGYPHFNVDNYIYEDSEKILIYAMEKCRDYDIPLIMHTEDMDQNKYKKLENLARKYYRTDRVLKHHANPQDLSIDNSILKSLVASRQNTRAGVESKKDFLLESDYTDQIEKPDKVIPPYSVPKRAEMIKNIYDNYEDILFRIFNEIPYKFYKKDFFLE
ncbi:MULTISPECIES: TatD family hydrolase [Acidiplasma]|jgi:TatD-related deoxyribonuclease|uniref:Molybdenum cofactor biosynthesis protein MoaA n=1 Tax=Acidiplasma aeolicum TaxID=507754 RepID=A0A0P9CK97_9ARCH|nr:MULTISPECIES: TatD family hydrolase [Acidiplasma]KJE49595.1 molybdenum cofactor biosynthesis protein MoaA [Acidiplasma sp. MBA-1]KPV46154.1 molybdenum cofactor biosynthesis protein MoaA [Acidiplasma aeolicum]WMT55858.1 MAG: TatD family hydrolase [Acidiplasma sp.]